MVPPATKVPAISWRRKPYVSMVAPEVTPELLVAAILMPVAVEVPVVLTEVLV